MEWQPIETAPKDGTAVLVYVPDGEYSAITTAECTDGTWFLLMTGEYAESVSLDPAPSHWMPLPEPPGK